MADHPPARHIHLDGTVNFRDVGGYPAAGGRTVRWGRLFRADGLSALTHDDLARIRDLGIATVVDLRSVVEVDAGRFPVDEVPVGFHHLPLIESVAEPETFRAIPGFLASSYVEMLELAADQIAQALRVVADPSHQPVVVHCTAGKDRTGVMIAIILSLLGVDDATIVEDYALSALGMHELRARLVARYPEAAEAIADADEMFSAAPENMEQLLSTVEERFGSMAAYVRGIGVDDATIDALCASLLEPLS